MQELVSNLWILAMSAVGALSLILGLLQKIRSINRNAKKKAEEHAEEVRKETERRVRLENRLVGAENAIERHGERLNELEKKDPATMEMHQALVTQITTMDAGLRTFVHQEIEKSDKKSAERAKSLHDKTDSITRRIDDMLSRKS